MRLSMIPKSGYRFSEKIMLKQKISNESDPAKLDQTLAIALKQRAIDPQDRVRNAVRQEHELGELPRAGGERPVRHDIERERAADRMRQREWIAGRYEPSGAQFVGHARGREDILRQDAERGC